MKFKIPIEGGEDDINMAPMIDMVFLLLIFFMVASHMSKLDRVPVELPEADESIVPENTPSRQLITLRSWDTSGEKVDIMVNMKKVEVGQVEVIIRNMREKDENAEVYLRADRYVKHKYVREVIAACVEGGMPGVIVAAFKSEDGK